MKLSLGNLNSKCCVQDVLFSDKHHNLLAQFVISLNILGKQDDLDYEGSSVLSTFQTGNSILRGLCLVEKKKWLLLSGMIKRKPRHSGARAVTNQFLTK